MDGVLVYHIIRRINKDVVRSILDNKNVFLVFEHAYGINN